MKQNRMEKETKEKKNHNPNIIALNAWPERNFCPGKN